MLVGGWTDEQIKNYSMDDLDGMIRSAEMAIESLQTSLDSETQRLGTLKLIKQRKLELK